MGHKFIKNIADYSHHLTEEGEIEIKSEDEKMPEIFEKFEKCSCLTRKEKDSLIEFIRDKQKEEKSAPKQS